MANLITLQQFKDAEGIQSPRDDYKISRIIDSVSQLVKTYCANSFVDFFSTNKVEEFSINWETYAVQLTESPVNTIVSVQKRDAVDASYTTLGASEYYLDKVTDSVLYVTGTGYQNWPIGAGAVKVTYTAGSFNIGQEQDSPGGGFDPNQTLNGDVAMVRIYDRVLSPSEVVTNYQQIKAMVY